MVQLAKNLQKRSIPGSIPFLANDHYSTTGVTLDADMGPAPDANGDQWLKAGTVLGKLTATGLYGPYKNTTLAAAAEQDQTEITVAYADAFVVGDTIVIGDEAATTITAIDYETGKITFGDKLSKGYAKDTTAVKANNGLETAAGILLDDVNMRDGDASVAMVVHGTVYAARCAGLNEAAKTSLAGRFYWFE